MLKAKISSKKCVSVKSTSPFVNAFLYALLSFFCGISCSNNPNKAPISSVSQPASASITHHVVAKGDTLYAIAWRYNLDYKNLSKINNINPPYAISPGQIIQLQGVAPRVPYRVSRLQKKAPIDPPKASAKVPSSKPPASKSPIINRSEKRTVKPVSVKATPVKTGSLVWSWPVKGKVISPFSVSGKLNKGIDIAAKLGESVRAAAEGEVVYAGSGLRGYGNLIIIKHRSSYLSAYAHNSKLIAKEGDVVKKREKIAEVGGSGTNAVKLHFEIRRDGVPVDPLRYLPR